MPFGYPLIFLFFYFAEIYQWNILIFRQKISGENIIHKMNFQVLCNLNSAIYILLYAHN